MKDIYAFTDEELHELANDSTSRVFVKKSVSHISLHAYHFADLKQSLCEIFDESINHFKPELNGIILSYRNIKVLNNIGKIINDDSRIHINVQADYYVFSPEVGCILTGIVNKKSSDHVGCLVHKLFNVSIPRPEEGSWEGENIELGKQISFVVEYMDFDLNLPYIRGRLQDPSLLPGWTEGATKKKKKKKIKEKSAEEELNVVEPAVEVADKDSSGLQITKKKKKKKKKEKESAEKLQDAFNGGEDEAGSENVSYEVNISTDLSDFSVLACSTQKDDLSPKKKKKKRKFKDLENEDTEHSDGVININELDSSHGDELIVPDETSLERKKKKKKKLYTNDDDVVIYNVEDAGRKTSKKLKKHKHQDVEEGTENYGKDVETFLEKTNKSPGGLLENVLHKYNSDEFKSTVTVTQTSHENKITSPFKTKKLQKSDGNHIGNSASKHENAEKTETSTEVIHVLEAHPPLAAKISKNFAADVGASVMDSIKGSPVKGTVRRKLSETELDEISLPKKRRSVGFSQEVEVKTISPLGHEDDMDEDSFHQPTLDTGTPSTSSSPIGSSALSNSFNSSLYSGASMANALDRKRRRIAKAVDIAAPKLTLNSRSPTLIGHGSMPIQSISQPDTKDLGTAVAKEAGHSPELSSPSNSEEEKGQTVDSTFSPQEKSTEKQAMSKETLLASPPKPLTQVESVSKDSQLAGLNKANEKLKSSGANVSADFNSSVSAFEPPNISHIIAMLKTGENPAPPKQEKSPKSTKAVSKEKKNKAENKEAKVVSAKSSHKGHKKDKNKKEDKEKKEKDKKDKDKKKKEHKSKKGNKEKKAKKDDVDDLTDLSRKLLQNFLKKQTGS